MYTLLVINIITVLSITGVVVSTKLRWSESTKLGLFTIGMIGGFITVGFGISIRDKVSSRQETLSEFYQFKKDYAKLNVSKKEEIELLKRKIEWNEALARAKYRRTTQWKWWTPEEIDTVTFIP